MAAKTQDAIQAMARQYLRDEFQTDGTEFAKDELSIYIGDCLIEISQQVPYEVKETVVGNGTQEVSLSSIEGLIGEKVVQAEYPTGNEPPSFEKFTMFGNTLRFEDAKPTSGKNIYLYCHEVHQLTRSTSTLSPELEKVLVDGVVAKASMAWLNKMRAQIVPKAVQLYEGWAKNRFAIYQMGLSQISKQIVWEY